MWSRLEVDGRDLGIDRTLNHQIFFAGAAASLRDYSKHVDEDLSRFIAKLPNRMGTYPSGLIKHHVWTTPSELSSLVSSRTYRTLAGGVPLYLRNYVPSNRIRDKEIAYHSFNLYGLSMLKKAYPNASTWETDLIEDVVSYATTADYLDAVSSLERGFNNILTGFHVGLCLWTFWEDVDAEDWQWWVTEQLRRGYDFDANRLDAGAADPTLQASKIFIIASLPDFELSG
ncbi:hypothetical protein ACH9L7_04965 [Haloferax sp. S1W]|uniref:hypothetical protein n=1 Tax=Haloferax sp. S1W TaxID=3377110 RepID=UPI0037C85E90